MQIIALEEKGNFLKIIEQKVKEYVYVDKFNRKICKIYKLADGQKIIFDVKKKREREDFKTPLIYNMNNVVNVKNAKRRKTIVFVEDEEQADLINKKSKSLVATTIFNGIDNLHVTEKVADIFRDTDIIITSKYEYAYYRVCQELFQVAHSIRFFNYTFFDNPEELTREELRIAKILNSQQRKRGENKWGKVN